MSVTPQLDVFTQGYQSGKTQLVYDTLLSDLHTPISASLALKEEGKPFFLLESVTGGNQRERYSIIGLNPDLIWKMDQESAYISEHDGPFIKQDEEPLTSFRNLNAAISCDIPKELPPMASGLIGYMSYDAIRLIESTIPDQNPDDCDIPLGMFMRPTMMVIFDSVTGTIYLITSVYVDDDIDAHTAYEDALKRIAGIKESLQKTLDYSPSTVSDQDKGVSFAPNMSKEAFKDMVEKAKEYIVAGDIFQVVPSQRFETDFKLPPFSFYRSLRHLNPSPFLFFLQFGDFQLIGSSPEIMVRLRDEEVTIRPLAGTRRRGKNSAEDKALSEELLADEKELAEHLMLVDLSRNDVGRVAKPGTVTVTEKNIIEYYSHVMHISSNVKGEIDPKYDAIDALFAGLL